MKVRVLSPDPTAGLGRTLNRADNLVVMCPIRAWAVVNELDLEYVVDIVDEEAPTGPRLACVELTVRRRAGGTPIRSGSVRLPVDALVREAVRRAAVPRRVTESTPAMQRASIVTPLTDHPRRSAGRPRAVPDTDLDAYLDVYEKEGMRSAMLEWRLYSKTTAIRTAKRAREQRAAAKKAAARKRAPRKSAAKKDGKR